MPRNYDVNIVTQYQETPSRVVKTRLSACLIGPNIQVFEDVPAGSYSASSSGTGAWIEYSLPYYDHSRHEPVDVDFWNELGGFNWMERIAEVKIRDEDGGTWTLSSANWEIDEAAGVVRVRDNVLLDLGVSFTGSAVGSTDGVYDGSNGKIFRVEVTDEGFPYVDGVKLKVGDIVSVPYVRHDIYNSDGELDSTVVKFWHAVDQIGTQAVGQRITGVQATGLSGRQVNLSTGLGFNDGDYVALELVSSVNNEVVWIVGQYNSAGPSINNAAVYFPERDYVSDVNSELIGLLPADVTYASLVAGVDEANSRFDLSVSSVNFNANLTDPNIPAVLLVAKFYPTNLNSSASDFSESAWIFKDLTAAPTYGSVLYRGADLNDPADLSADDEPKVLGFLLYVPRIWAESSGGLVDVKFFNGGSASESVIPTWTAGTVDAALFKVEADKLEETELNSTYEPWILQFLSKFAPDSANGYDVAIVTSGTGLDNNALGSGLHTVLSNAVLASEPTEFASFAIVGAFHPFKIWRAYQEPATPVKGTVVSLSGQYVQLFFDSSVVGTDSHFLPLQLPIDVAGWSVERYASGEVLVSYMVFDKYVPDEPYEIRNETDVQTYLGNTSTHPYAILAYGAYLGLLNNTDDNRTVSFYLLPIGGQSEEAIDAAIKQLEKLSNQLTGFGTLPPVFYELALSSTKSEHILSLLSFANDRARPLWSDPRRVWASEPLPPLYEEKVPLRRYSSLSADVLMDSSANFRAVGVRAGDYVDVLPSSADASVNLSPTYSFSVTTGRLSVTFTVPPATPNLTGLYFFVDFGARQYHGRVVRSVAANRYLLELSEPADESNVYTAGTIYFFADWATYEVVEVVNQHTIRLNAEPVTPFASYYKLYSSMTTDELVDYWISRARFYNSPRLVLLNPKVQVLHDGSTWTLPGFYLAMAKAVQASALSNISKPLTHRPVSGFTHAFYGNDTFDPEQIMRLSQGGVDVHVDLYKNGPIASHRQVTTFYSQTDATHGYREQSVVKVVDYITHAIVRTLEQYTGLYNASDSGVQQNIANAIYTLMRSWTSPANRNRSILNAARLQKLVLVTKPDDLPDYFEWPDDVPFETGFYVEIYVEHKVPLNRIVTLLKVSKPLGQQT